MKDNTGKRENNMEFQNLITLIESVSASGLTELKYEENGVKIKLSKKRKKSADDPGIRGTDIRDGSSYGRQK